MKTNNHTPTPWAIGQYPGNNYKLAIYSNIDQTRIAVLDKWSDEFAEETDANAEFIVHACNNFDDMLEALKREHAANLVLVKQLREAYERFTDNDMVPPNHELAQWLKETRICLKHGTSETTQQAIAKAQTRPE